MSNPAHWMCEERWAALLGPTRDSQCCDWYSPVKSVKINTNTTSYNQISSFCNIFQESSHSLRVLPGGGVIGPRQENISYLNRLQAFLSQALLAVIVHVQLTMNMSSLMMWHLTHLIVTSSLSRKWFIPLRLIGFLDDGCNSNHAFS